MTRLVIPEKPNDAMPEVSVGRASAFCAELIGVADDLENVQVHFGSIGDISSNAVAARRVPGGIYRVYANGFYFPNVGKAHYHVTAKTAQGDSTYLGGGTLRVIQSVLNVPAPQVPIVPDTACAFNPRTGLYYRIVAELNDDGEVVLAAEKEGFTK